MAEHGFAVRAVGGPIVARRVDAGGERTAVGVRTCQDVVFVRRLAEAFDEIALFGQHIRLLNVIAVALVVAVQIADVGRHHHAFSIVPRSCSDAARSHPVRRPRPGC
jgi:hypothetical protein